jgi:hypothetical protein
MRKTLTIGAVCGALSLSAVAVAPTSASAACSGATTGTIVGGVGGALIGNSISHGGGGAFLGGLGGAVVGHEIGKSGCAHTTTRHATRTRHGEGYDYRRSYPTTYAYRSGPGVCHTEDQSYYDANGSYVRRAVQVCD